MVKLFKPKEEKKANLSWEQYYMGIAQLVKSRSKDPATTVGSCIVLNNRIISTGYNGFPSGLSDLKYPWSKDSDMEIENKYFYVVHSELNAILSAKKDLTGATIYVTLFPCNECAKAIIQSGIKKVVYYGIDDGDEIKIRKNDSVKQMFSDAGIEYKKYMVSGNEIKIIV